MSKLSDKYNTAFNGVNATHAAKNQGSFAQQSPSKNGNRYNHLETEKKWQKYWLEKQIYKWEKNLDRKDTFVIDTPPPTVSGLLHMGHIFSYTQADFVARFQRMNGKTVFYPMGFDDNGLPTERLVEKVKNIKAYEMARPDFVKECLPIVEEAEKEFENLFNSIALSVDWNEKYQTISKQSQKISQLSFIDLFRKNLVERQLAPILWDVVDRTALSQADLVDSEKSSFMHDIEFSIVGSDEKIIIATTRPELLGACVAVMINPDDERYKYLIGKNAITALFDVPVPIIADELVQKDKGTGAVMCCTFGDETDIKWWKKYNLPLRMIVTKDGRINPIEAQNSGSIEDFFKSLDAKILDAANNEDLHDLKSKLNNLGDHEKEIDDLMPVALKYIGKIYNLKIDAADENKSARKKIINLLKEKNLLKKSEPITHNVKCAERSGAPIEILVMPEWFIKILDKKEQLKNKAAQCNWYPSFMKVRMDQWIDGISWDWCISRQRFFGVPFPVWYSKRIGEEGKILVADIDQLPCDPIETLPKGYSRQEVDAETDIMDTWATSSVSPQLSSQGINDEIHLGDLARHNKLFPADLRPQGHEIIRSWAFYTIVKSMLHQDEIPWKNLMISGWCLAPDKTKMSKSKGNVITPGGLIEEKGSDVVRYWASTSNLGSDTAYSDDVLKIGNKLLNKLFNAANFVSLNFTELKVSPTTAKNDVSSGAIDEAIDLWILSRLSLIISQATEEFEKFEYAKAREAIEYFFWNDFCDNYLEIIKIRCYGLGAEKYKDISLSAEEENQIIKKQQSAIVTLYHCLEAILRLFAPFVPHISEELYSEIFADKFNEIGSIHSRGNWPKTINYIQNADVLEVGKIAIEIIFNIRKYKSSHNLSMKTPIQQFTINSKIDISSIIKDLENVCGCQKILIRNEEGDLITNIVC